MNVAGNATTATINPVIADQKIILESHQVIRDTGMEPGFGDKNNMIIRRVEV